ncbi:MAG TPA: DUF2130 domain-containing protein [Oscillatoriales cyanobacterium M59_W2019_021]|nr:MAG: DUF2130 domain-containing protein [Cyanobacteria bacterium J055]HIK30624.1 DUF2130 domain-containing protein [Oscillatoriales cyanobacterium M4454_W2019_049]HIK52134.1 DUF2130 domain-containing protein [Oscillatoriales cyanobacterium M59_W2019_021]
MPQKRTEIARDRQVKCPECGAEFEVEAILRENIEQELRQQLTVEIRDRLTADLQTQIEQELEAKLHQQIASLKAESKIAQERLHEQIEEAKQRNQRLQAEKAALKQAERELQDLKEEMEEKLDIARYEASRETKQKLKQEYQEQLSRDLQKALADKEIELTEKAEKERQLKAQLDELQQKLEQGSMQLQGEGLELAIEETLRKLFPRDHVTEIKKGAFGADLTQIVVNRFGASVGKIIYESKKQKNWQDEWLQKLRQDAIAEKADLKVIVSTSLPKNFKGFGQIDDIFICQYHELPVVVALLREVLIQVHQEKNVQENMKTVQEQIVDYIRSDEFITVMTMVQDAYHAFSEDLRKEEEYMKKRWKARRDYLSKITTGMTSVLGSLAAIGGSQLNFSGKLFNSKPPEFLLSESDVDS